MGSFFIIFYLLPMLMIFAYSMLQLSLIINQKSYSKPSFESKDFKPKVTIQLPIYNEMYVVERLLDSVCKMNYPQELLEIQVLDDSTDDTSEILAKKVKVYAEKGIDIKHIQRENREGYKAGALKYGMEIAKGEFIAIFDADFLPDPEFLNKTVPHFQNKEVGLVQSRWGHVNEKYSVLTKLQAFGLNAHFFIEQTGRNAKQHYINFNGTGGIWRKETIINAGGWSADTITEDLDLSYRAQLKNWKFLYIEDLISPAELPVTMQAIRSQQYRWMKGGAECLMKNTKAILSSKSTPFASKIHGFFHLLNSSVFLFVFLLSTVSIVLTLHPTFLKEYGDWLKITVLFQVNWVILGSFYWIAFKKEEKSVLTFVGRFLLFLTYMMGLSLHNAIAVVEGLTGKKTPFVRTPKFNITDQAQNWNDNIYRVKNLGAISYFEMALFALFGVSLFFDIQNQYWGMIPFHTMCFLGYGMVLFFTIKHAFRKF